MSYLSYNWNSPEDILFQIYYASFSYILICHLSMRNLHLLSRAVVLPLPHSVSVFIITLSLSLCLCILSICWSIYLPYFSVTHSLPLSFTLSVSLSLLHSLCLSLSFPLSVSLSLSLSPPYSLSLFLPHSFTMSNLHTRSTISTPIIWRCFMTSSEESSSNRRCLIHIIKTMPDILYCLRLFLLLFRMGLMLRSP